MTVEDENRAHAPKAWYGRSKGILLAALMSTTALAQTAPSQSAGAGAAPQPSDDGLSEIVVTGSKIRGVGPIGSPVTGLSPEDVANLGVASTADALRTIPSVLNLGADPSHQNANEKANLNTTAGTSINLRGLGPQATLVLVDGRRIAPAGVGAQFTDPTVIPEAAVGLIEVVADGASAIYGADAVGGVVNLKLREPFDGAETSVRYGGGSSQDSLQISQVFGHTWDGGGVMVALQHLDQSRVTGASVSQLYTDNYSFHGGPNTGSTSSAPGNIIVGKTSYALPANPTGSQITASELTPGTSNLQSYYAGADAIPAQTQDEGVFSLKQRLTDDIKLFSEGFFSRRKFDQNRTATADGLASLSVPSINPNYIRGIPGLAPNAPETVQYSGLVDFGPLHQQGGQKAGSLTVGADIALFGDWQLEPSVSYSQDNEQRYQSNLINNCALTGALGVTSGGTGGHTLTGVPCSGTPALYDTNAATAFNPFAPGLTNPATIARISASNNDQTEFDRLGAGLKLDGTVFALPGGNIRMAVGFEHYDDSLHHTQTRNDGNYTPDVNSYVNFSGTNSRSNNAVYAETVVPVIGSENALPFAEKIELSLAGRYEHYSDFGTTTNPKFGLNWKPVNDLLFHASYGTSFRAPTLSEDDGRDVVGTPGVSVTSVTNLLYPSLGPIGSKVNAISIVGGNSSVKPETAETYSFGTDYTPSWLQGAKLSANYFNVNYQNVISAINAGSALTDPSLVGFVNLHPTAAQIAALCTSRYFTAGNCATSPVAIIDGSSRNLGATKTNGVEFTATYRKPTTWGTWSGGVTGSYVNSFQQALTPGAPLIQRVNQVNFPLKFAGRATLGWDYEGFSIFTFINHENGYRNLTIVPAQGVDPYTTVDLTASYDPAELLTSKYVSDLLLSVHVTNLLDAKPPFVYQPGNPPYAFDPQNASALGRTAYLQLTAQF